MEQTEYSFFYLSVMVESIMLMTDCVSLIPISDYFPINKLVYESLRYVLE